MTPKLFGIILFAIAFSAWSCVKRQESLAKIESVPTDSLVSGGVSDEVLDEFEYEADSLAADEDED